MQGSQALKNIPKDTPSGTHINLSTTVSQKPYHEKVCFFISHIFYII